jgi:serine protease Do
MKVLRNKQEKSLSITIEELDLEAESASNRGPGGEGESQAGAGFGLTIRNVTPDIARRLRLPQGVTGVVVTDIEQASGASRAGLQVGDVILEINRQPVASTADAQRLLDRVQSGERAQMLVWRNGQKQGFLVRKD